MQKQKTVKSHFEPTSAAITKVKLEGWNSLVINAEGELSRVPVGIKKSNPDKRDKCGNEIIFCQKNAKNNFLLTKLQLSCPTVINIKLKNNENNHMRAKEG